MFLIHQNVKYAIIMFQCKTYLNTDLFWITNLVCSEAEVDMFSAFPYYGLANKLTLNFDSKFHDYFLMKCLHNSITQNDTIWWQLYLNIYFLTLKLHINNVTLNM